jgi:type II secretory pathway predicted ATPase ExeA
MLTAQQLVDARRFAGYQALADTSVDDDQDFAYVAGPSGTRQTLQHRLTNLRDEEEAILVNTYLMNLTALEQGILDAAANLDTNQAAVWVRNPREVQERTKLFTDWRRRMCSFLGIAPGPDLGSGGIRVVRV